MTSYHQILGVSTTASDSEIKKAYKKLAMKYHPDRGGNADKFKELQDAYQHLMEAKSNPHVSTDYSDWSSYEFHKYEFNMDDFVYNVKRKSQTKKTYTYKIKLEEAFTGKVIQYNGKNIRIPCGIRSGSKIYADGIFLEITVLPHHKFQRADDDLLVDIFISCVEAMLGIEVTISNIDQSKLKFKVQPGIQPGKVIRLANKGMPNPELDKKGDLLVRCNIFIPDKISNEDIIKISSLIKHNRKSIEI